MGLFPTWLQSIIELSPLQDRFIPPENAVSVIVVNTSDETDPFLTKDGIRDKMIL
jgi:hypothetical protein